MTVVNHTQLPLTICAAKPGDQVEPGLDRMIDIGAHRILVVDDAPDDRALVRREAEGMLPGVEVSEAGSRHGFEVALAAGEYPTFPQSIQLSLPCFPSLTGPGTLWRLSENSNTNLEPILKGRAESRVGSAKAAPMLSLDAQSRITHCPQR
jgi:hypothetical protein